MRFWKHHRYIVLYIDIKQRTAHHPETSETTISNHHTMPEIVLYSLSSPLWGIPEQERDRLVPTAVIDNLHDSPA